MALNNKEMNNKEETHKALRMPWSRENRGLGSRLSLLLFKGFSGTLLFLIFLSAISVTYLLNSDFNLPTFVIEKIHKRIEMNSNDYSLNFNAASIRVNRNTFQPVVKLSGVSVSYNAQNTIQLPVLLLDFKFQDLIKGNISPVRLKILKPEALLVMDGDGQIAFGLSGDLKDFNTIKGLDPRPFPELMQLFQIPIFANLDNAHVSGIKLVFEDKEKGKRFIFDDGEGTLSKKADLIEINISTKLDQLKLVPAKFTGNVSYSPVTGVSKVAVSFRNLDTHNLSDQIYSFGWFQLFNGNAAGSFRGEIDSTGSIGDFAGAIAIRDGSILPNPSATPYLFDEMNSHVRYVPKLKRMFFDNISLKASELKFEAFGSVDFLRDVNGSPGFLIGQLEFGNIEFNPEGLFDSAINFKKGIFDFKYNLSDSNVDIGQLLLSSAGSEILTSGRISTTGSGWKVALDSSVNDITASNLLALWPQNFKEKTRAWIEENVVSGLIKNGRSSLRVHPEKPLELALSFDFEDASINILKDQPKLQKSSGYGSINNNLFSLNLEKGFVNAGGEGLIDFSGSTMIVRDISEKPATGEFNVVADGPLSGMFLVLKKKPFYFFSEIKEVMTNLKGIGRIETKLKLPLVKELKIKDVTYSSEGVLRDLKSTNLIKGRFIEGKPLLLKANNKKVTVSGDAFLDGVPLSLSWVKKIEDNKNYSSFIEGKTRLSKKSLDALGISISPDFISGGADGKFRVLLRKNSLPSVVLTSNLRGLGLEFPPLDWVKELPEVGNLKVTFELNDELLANPIKDLIIELSSSNLEAKSSVLFKPDGKINKVNLDLLKISQKINSSVLIQFATENTPTSVLIDGGTVDFRKINFESGFSKSPFLLKTNLDLLIISERTRLHNFVGSFVQSNGFGGDFAALLNNQVEISGDVSDVEGVPLTTVNSSKGGDVLRSLGLVKGANGGELIATFHPSKEKGMYDGSLSIKNIRLKDAPILADLLAATSIIGILEQLSGDGILFTDTVAEFVLENRGVTLNSASAIGASLGITMDGIFDSKENLIEMQGVISPMYVVNGMLLGKLFAPRQGEGLIGFNYVIDGSPEEPKASINPLSLFTPGFFREIFRRPQAELN